jgi:hypothetical protein
MLISTGAFFMDEYCRLTITLNHIESCIPNDSRLHISHPIEGRLPDRNGIFHYEDLAGLKIDQTGLLLILASDH